VFLSLQTSPVLACRKGNPAENVRGSVGTAIPETQIKVCSSRHFSPPVRLWHHTLPAFPPTHSFTARARAATWDQCLALFLFSISSRRIVAVNMETRGC